LSANISGTDKNIDNRYATAISYALNKKIVNFGPQTTKLCLLISN